MQWHSEPLTPANAKVFTRYSFWWLQAFLNFMSTNLFNAAWQRCIKRVAFQTHYAEADVISARCRSKVWHKCMLRWRRTGVWPCDTEEKKNTAYMLARRGSQCRWKNRIPQLTKCKQHYNKQIMFAPYLIWLSSKSVPCIIFEGRLLPHLNLIPWCR